MVRQRKNEVGPTFRATCSCRDILEKGGQLPGKGNSEEDDDDEATIAAAVAGGIRSNESNLNLKTDHDEVRPADRQHGAGRPLPLPQFLSHSRSERRSVTV